VIVQPTPTGPRSPARRRLRAAGLVAPVVLLVAVAGLAIAGPRDPAVNVAPTPAPVAVPPASPSLQPRASVVFPTVAADLGVRSVDEIQAWLDDLTPGPVAAAGWLTDLHPDGDCPAAAGDTRGAYSPLCLRRARLDAGPDGDAADIHVHLTIAPGTGLPSPLERGDALPAAIPIVVVGHTGVKMGPCLATANDCRSDLDVERVTWSDGAPFDPGPVFDAWLEAAPPALPLSNLESAETLAIGWYGTILQAALLRPATVATVDADAGRVLAAAPRTRSLVWYVLGLETGYDPVHALHGQAPPRYSWVVLDYVTGATIARGPKR
jgi:hypothetical protein